LAESPTFDSLIQARTGLVTAQGDDRGPQLVRMWVADKVTALLVAQTVLAGLVARGATGEGCVADLPMVDALSYFNLPDVLVPRTVIAETTEPPFNEQIRVQHPLPTADGWILLSPVGKRQVEAMLTVLGTMDRRAELFSVRDPATFTTTLLDIAATVTPGRTTTEWLEGFRQADVPAGPVLSLDEHLADPELAGNEIYAVVDDPRIGPIRQAHHPAHFFGKARHPVRPAPDLPSAG
jgi:crotonobetainyl-CoA:carnitine CoA-transferase CaiB-like acyl-CoA transferase